MTKSNIVEKAFLQYYQDMKSEIIEVDSSVRHYGYFDHAVTVQNTETMDTFEVYYDKKMSWMEDSIKLEQIENDLNFVIQSQIEQYVQEHFGETRYINVSYSIGFGKPQILVKFEEHHSDITQADFDEFVVFLQQSVGLSHAHVIVDYWMRELTFKTEF